KRVLAVLCLAAALRLGAAIVFPVGVGIADAGDYQRLGVALVQGEGVVDIDGKPTTFRPPAYPAFIAATYLFVGVRPGAVRVVQAFLDVGTCALIAWWARRREGPRVAFYALVLSALSLSMIAAVRSLLSE